MVTVCTVLAPGERPRLDAVGDGCFTTLHANSLGDALRRARGWRVDALVFSVPTCCGDELPAVERFVRDFPRIRAVALVSRYDAAVPDALLRLGASGVRSVVDCTGPTGWARLAALLEGATAPAAAPILARIVPALGAAGGAIRVFFETLAVVAPELSTLRRLAGHLRTCPTTLASRFSRASLPSPKTYLAGMRLLHAAYHFGNPGLTVADVTERLHYSSPQNFARHVQLTLGVGAREFRRRFPFDDTLNWYVDRLITPYRGTLCALPPWNAEWGAVNPPRPRVPEPTVNPPRRGRLAVRASLALA